MLLTDVSGLAPPLNVSAKLAPNLTTGIMEAVFSNANPAPATLPATGRLYTAQILSGAFGTPAQTVLGGAVQGIWNGVIDGTWVSSIGTGPSPSPSAIPGVIYIYVAPVVNQGPPAPCNSPSPLPAFNICPIPPGVNPTTLATAAPYQSPNWGSTATPSCSPSCAPTQCP